MKVFTKQARGVHHREDNNRSIGPAIDYEVILSLSFNRRAAMVVSEDIANIKSRGLSRKIIRIHCSRAALIVSPRYLKTSKAAYGDHFPMSFQPRPHPHASDSTSAK